MKLSEIIQQHAEKLGAQKSAYDKLRTQHEELLQKTISIDPETEDDAELETLTKLEAVTAELETNAKSIEKLEKHLDLLKKQEKSQANSNPSPAPAIGTLPQTHKRNRPGDRIIKVFAAKAMAKRDQISEAAAVEQYYGDDQETKAVFGILSKAAITSATTTATGWAAELVTDDIGAMLEDIESISVAAALALAAENNGGMRIMFGQNVSKTIPRITPTGANPTEPAWVGEGGRFCRAAA